MKIGTVLFLAAVLALTLAPVEARETTFFNEEIAVSPWAGEAPSKGTFSVRHEGKGEPPEKGYFRKHEPGEVAEYHLFVPDGLDPARGYPLLIVYHGGKDGASGKGMCGRFARLSTAEHPVIVLSPNMYTQDAYNELVAEWKLPIDTRRVVVYGHSSGGMGVLSAMAEYRRTSGRFLPAALICASTTASLGQGVYPPCPYYVMAGEKETPAFVQNEILKERRRVCRIHALTMQQVFREVRYVEVKGSGHSGGTPTHAAVIQHAVAVSERAPVLLKARAGSLELALLLDLAQSGDWPAVRKEMTRLDGLADLAPRAEYEKLRPAILDALEKWFEAEMTAIGGLSPKSSYVERDRAFLRHDRCRAVAAAYAGTPAGKALEKSLGKLDGAKHLSAELAARKAYQAIVAGRPGPAMKPKLEALRKSAPDTEYGRNRTLEKLLALQEIQPQPEPAELPDGPPITNPYYPNQKWRVWRDDATPVPNVQTLVRDGKEKKVATVTLAPTPEAQRIYPAGPLEEGKPILWKTRATPSERFSGVWDDVYASWSGLHGYVRSVWHTKDGSTVHLRPKGLDHIMHFVETRKTAEILRCGINFVHQSTTGMAHTITNSYNQKMTESYEKIYFSDCLVTSPAHASFTEEWADRTKDMYLALVPTLFNSVGSSNSETMAITKMMIVGGYLPPASKALLKRHGLYPSALLHMWKASLPYDVPYDHELRHRIAYRALGHEDQFASKYGHAGGERGNLSLEFHRYDEIAHMRNMIRMAQSMTVLPPEAILEDVEVEGGRGVYHLKKAALVLQEPGQDVTVTLSTAGCYDLQSLPITVRFKLLYGTPATTCERGEKPDTWIIRVPWDDALPEGRTAIALIANNGVLDGNPAIVNVYRKRRDVPPPGSGPGGYSYDSPHANRRPVIVGLQDRIVKAGETLRIPLRGIDPEGQNVRFFKRAGEPGALDGNLYTFVVPDGPAGTEHAVTFIASDGTAGNSYAAKRVRFVVAPPVHARIDCASLMGPAPFEMKVSAKGSRVASGKMEIGWEFYRPAPKRKAAAWDKQSHEQTATHTFAKPGLYEVALTVKSGKLTDRETLTVWVTDGPVPDPSKGLIVEGNGVRIRDGDDTPSAFDHTHFGEAPDGGRIVRTFDLFNRGGKELVTTSRSIVLGGPHGKDFRVVRSPRKNIVPGGQATFEIAFKSRGSGRRTAEVTLRGTGATVRFAIAGGSAVDQKSLDAEAEPVWLAAKRHADDKAWVRAEKALVDFLERFPAAKRAGEATALLERIRTDPEIRKAVESSARAEKEGRAAKKQETRAKALYALAENFVANGRTDLADKTWKEIVAKYPGTTWAEKAKRRLAE
jgi:hypothetical protein